MPDYEVLIFSDINLFAGLANPLLSPAEISKHSVAQYLSRYLKEIEARTIVVELEYTDGDYLDDFSAYYAKCFFAYPRRCKRLHLFSSHFDESFLLNMICSPEGREGLEEFRNSYLGFIVARPLPEAIIGRTAIGNYASDNGRRHYPCTKIYSASLFGIDLKVRSLAFQEQDSVLAACATVSLWCAFHKTAEIFGTSIPTPGAITRVANRVVRPSRPFPSQGLDVYQICNSIRHMDLEAEVVEVKPNSPIVSLIYAHLSMGIPVIVGAGIEGVGFHAITLNGYSLKDSKVRTSEVAPGEHSIAMTGLRIDEFYGHDDQIGPFARLVVKPSEKIGDEIYPAIFDGSWTDPATGTFRKIYPKVIIIPIYHKIRVTFIDVQKWLTRLNAVLQVSPISGFSPDLEWDVSLKTSNHFKSLLKGSDLSEDRKRQLLLLQHPRFIWHVSLCTPGGPLLNLLIDATDMARSFPVYQCIWHDATAHSQLAALLNASSLQNVLVSILTQRFYDFLKSSTPP